MNFSFKVDLPITILDINFRSNKILLEVTICSYRHRIKLLKVVISESVLFLE